MEQRFGIKRIATRSTQTEKRHVVMFVFAENSNSKYSVASLNIPEHGRSYLGGLLIFMNIKSTICDQPGHEMEVHW